MQKMITDESQVLDRYGLSQEDINYCERGGWYSFLTKTRGLENGDWVWDVRYVEVGDIWYLPLFLCGFYAFILWGSYYFEGNYEAGIPACIGITFFICLTGIGVTIYHNRVIEKHSPLMLYRTLEKDLICVKNKTLIKHGDIICLLSAEYYEKNSPDDLCWLEVNLFYKEQEAIKRILIYTFQDTYFNHHRKSIVSFCGEIGIPALVMLKVNSMSDCQKYRIEEIAC